MIQEDGGRGVACEASVRRETHVYFIIKALWKTLSAPKRLKMIFLPHSVFSGSEVSGLRRLDVIKTDRFVRLGDFNVLIVLFKHKRDNYENQDGVKELQLSCINKRYHCSRKTGFELSDGESSVCFIDHCSWVV